jgi:sulfate transport system permease protein
MSSEAVAAGAAPRAGVRTGRAGRVGLRVVALGYLAALLLVPVGVVLYRTLEPGIGDVWASITTPAAIHAFWLTITIALIAVPLNTAFGILTALILVRSRVRGKRVLEAFIDLPFAVSPVVIGLALVLLYGRTGWFGPWLSDHGIQIIFSVPGMILATIFVCLPFVVREVAPVLREIGDDQEQAAATLGATRWQTFLRITLPAIRWGVAYGVVLSTARAIGEFGAVSVVSGKISGETISLPLLVEQRWTNFDLAGAYAASALLAVIALATLLAMTLLQRKGDNA